MRARIVVTAMLAAFAVPLPAGAEFPYPSCGGCPDPADYQAYLFNPVTSPPTIPSEVDPLDFRASSLVDPALPSTPEELFGVAGMSVDLAWQTTTGRPDVVIAILDSGIVYDEDLASKAVLNRGELTLPEGSAVFDANADGVFNVLDYAGDSRVFDADGNGILDPRDLIVAFSDGVDDDANGYVDDICGWDTHERDNDPLDDVGYGHGTGQARGSVGEVNNGGSWGIAPSAMFLPVKVGDSFVADSNDFAAGVAFAVDSGVTIISEALGALNNTPFARAAIEHARQEGIPIVASAADEQSYHRNYPAANEHVFWAHSVRPEDGTLVTNVTNLLFNGCTNYGGKAQVAIASTSCSSEATERAAGIFALLYSAAKNEIDRGNLAPHPIYATPLSPDEAAQLVQMTADDIDFSIDPALSFDPTLAVLLPQLVSERFPSRAGYDKYFGYGRANVGGAVARIASGSIPPEADILAPRWFEVIDPVLEPLVEVRGTAAAWRNANAATYTVAWACGVDPAEAEFALAGHQLVSLPLGGVAVIDDLLGLLDTTGIETECGFDTLTLPRTHEDDFDESFAITIRLQVEDTLGNVGEARKNVFIHHDPSLRAGFPMDLGASLEPAPVLTDIDGDGAQEAVIAASDGRVHALRADGSQPAGWPVTTALLALPVGAPAYAPAALGSDSRAAILAAPAVGDLEGDGTPEVVAADMEGFVYVYEHDGLPRAGFPVQLDPTFSDPAIRDAANRVDAAVLAAPTLADLDADGDLEIIIAAADRHLYVWREDGSLQPGFPLLVVDRDRMQSIDPVTDKVVWKQIGGGPVGSRGTKLVGSPSVGDLDGDGDLEIVVGSNEEYVRGEEANVSIASLLFSTLADQLDLPNGRLYAVSHMGTLDPDVQTNPSGPFLPGWPVKVAILIADLLPTVGHGVGASPVLADVDDDGDDEVFISGNNGPVFLLNGDGTNVLGTRQDKFVPLDVIGSPATNPGASSTDLSLVFATVGGGAAGDLDGDTVVDFAMPTTGVLQLLDVQAPAHQGPGDHQLTAWSGAGGQMLPDFPQVVEDLQFLTAPTIGDIDGDGTAELLQGSGGYYLHAFGGLGGQAPDWPKFTGGWTTGSIGLGDIDGNGLVDAVAGTREGRLYAWEAGGSFGGAGTPPIQWATIGRDAQHSGSVNSGAVTSLAPPGCSTLYRGVIGKATAKFGAGAADDRVKVKGLVNMPGRALDPPTVAVRVSFGDPSGTAVYQAEIPAGSFATNAKGTTFKFRDKTLTLADGLAIMKIKRRKALWQFQFVARNVDAAITGEKIHAFVGIGENCLERARTCESKKGGQILKCR